MREVPVVPQAMQLLPVSAGSRGAARGAWPSIPPAPQNPIFQRLFLWAASSAAALCSAGTGGAPQGPLNEPGAENFSLGACLGARSPRAPTE